MRFFFHMTGEYRMVLDDEEIVGDNLEQARRQAISTIEELLENSTESGLIGAAA